MFWNWILNNQLLYLDNKQFSSIIKFIIKTAHFQVTIFYWLKIQTQINLSGFFSFENVGQTAFSTVLPVKVTCHENSSTTFRKWAFSAKAVDLTVLLDLLWNYLMWVGVLHWFILTLVEIECNWCCYFNFK